MAEGKRIAAWHPNVVVKVAMSEEGLGAMSRLAAAGIAVNCTLVFSANQALLAARAGATYVSPFVGRLDDGARTAWRWCGRRYRSSRRITSPRRCWRPACATRSTSRRRRWPARTSPRIPPAVLFQMVHHPLTDAGMERFLADAAKYTAV